MPDSLAAAKKCTTPDEIAQWKKEHIAKILSLKVFGEPGNDEEPESKVLKLRDSEHLDLDYQLKKNFEFPRPEEFNFASHVCGFTSDGSVWGLNVIMSNGSKSKLPMPQGWTDYRLKDGQLPRKVTCWFKYTNGHSHLNGIQYFDADNKEILDVGNCFGQ